MKFTIYTRKGMPLEVEPTSIDESGWYFTSEDWKDHICDAPEWEYLMPDGVVLRYLANGIDHRGAREFLVGYALALIQAWYTEAENTMHTCDRCDRLCPDIYDDGKPFGICRECDESRGADDYEGKANAAHARTLRRMGI